MIQFKCEVDADVSEIFKKDVANMSSDQKVQVVKEMEADLKNLMLKRNYILNMKHGKDNHEVPSANSKTTPTVTFQVTYQQSPTAVDFNVNQTDTMASVRESIVKFFNIPKSHAREWALMHGDHDLCETSRITVSGIMKKLNMGNNSPITLLKYN